MNAQQLKNSILQMAVQGKLVPQDPNDEPASVLLERIRKEKEKLIKEGKIKREKNPSYIFRGEDNLPYEKVGKNGPVCIADEVPFEIPDSWAWCKLSFVTYPVGNKDNQILSKTVKSAGKIPVVSQGADLIEGYCDDDKKLIDDLPLVMFGDHTRNVKYIDFPFVIGADGTKFHKVLICDAKYIFYWMSYAALNLRNRGYARHYSLLVPMLIPIPPIEEQKRIVNKIESLIPLVKEFNIKERRLESLNDSFPELLKKSILQQAVMGKLVPQNSNDEPASVLLEQIRVEKNALIKAGKLKKDKHESIIYRRDNSYYEIKGKEEVCIDEEIPFEIPDSWVWVRLSNVIDVRDGTHDTPGYIPSGYPLITGKDFYTGVFDLSKTQYISEKDYAEIKKRSKVDVGDILFSMIGGNIGSMIKITDDNYFDMGIKNVALFKQYNYNLSLADYLFVFLKSQVNKFKAVAQGGAQSFVSLNLLRNYLFPLPPLEEQRRIVERTEELLLSCGRMNK